MGTFWRFVSSRHLPVHSYVVPVGGLIEFPSLGSVFPLCFPSSSEVLSCPEGLFGSSRFYSPFATCGMRDSLCSSGAVVPHNVWLTGCFCVVFFDLSLLCWSRGLMWMFGCVWRLGFVLGGVFDPSFGLRVLDDVVVLYYVHLFASWGLFLQVDVAFFCW